MNKAYDPITWEDRPSTASPIDQINLNGLSRGVSTIDDRVIDLDSTVDKSVKNIAVNETTGRISITLNDGTTYDFNPSSRIYSQVGSLQQYTQTNFSSVSSNFQSVGEMLADMDMKIDLTADGANAGIENLQTTITMNDGYYRREISGVRRETREAYDHADALDGATNQRITTVSSSITQTTEAIQLQVTELSEYTDGRVSSLQSQINQTAGQISLKVSKHEIIDGLDEEFGSGISLTPDRITIASTGALVVHTENFKLDEDGDAEFKGAVFMQEGYVGGYPIVTVNDGVIMSGVNHAVHAWKLRSGAVNENDVRYYTYMTMNKNLIVSNDEEHKHNSENDVTDDCQIGSLKFPWGAGYFKSLYVKKHNVIPEALRITLPSSGWTASGSYFTQTKQVNGMSGDVYLYIATDNATDLDLVYVNSIDVDTIEENEVTFLAKTQPASDVDLILLCEDFIYSNIEGAELRGSFDIEANQLSCLWSSPKDRSKYITWLKDELIIERCIDEEHPELDESWEQVLVVPATGETPFEADQYEDNPLVVGSAAT